MTKMKTGSGWRSDLNYISFHKRIFIIKKINYTGSYSVKCKVYVKLGMHSVQTVVKIVLFTPLIS